MAPMGLLRESPQTLNLLKKTNKIKQTKTNQYLQSTVN